MSDWLAHLQVGAQARAQLIDASVTGKLLAAAERGQRGMRLAGDWVSLAAVLRLGSGTGIGGRGCRSRYGYAHVVTGFCVWFMTMPPRRRAAGVLPGLTVASRQDRFAHRCLPRIGVYWVRRRRFQKSAEDLR